MIKINIVLDATKLRLKNETAKKFLGFFIGKSRFSVAFRLLFGCFSVAFRCVGCRISKTNGAPSLFHFKTKKDEKQVFLSEKMAFQKRFACCYRTHKNLIYIKKTPLFAIKTSLFLDISLKKGYICIVFFIVLDLRLTKIGLQR